MRAAAARLPADLKLWLRPSRSASAAWPTRPRLMAASAAPAKPPVAPCSTMATNTSGNVGHKAVMSAAAACTKGTTQTKNRSDCTRSRSTPAATGTSRAATKPAVKTRPMSRGDQPRSPRNTDTNGTKPAPIPAMKKLTASKAHWLSRAGTAPAASRDRAGWFIDCSLIDRRLCRGRRSFARGQPTERLRRQIVALIGYCEQAQRAGDASRRGGDGPGGEASSAYDGKRGDRRNRHPGAPRPAALGPLPYPGGDRARHHLGARWARGDARRRRVAGPEGEPAAPLLQCRCRACQQRLSRRRGAGRAHLRLAHRSAPAPAGVFFPPLRSFSWP